MVARRTRDSSLIGTFILNELASCASRYFFPSFLSNNLFDIRSLLTIIRKKKKTTYFFIRLSRTNERLSPGESSSAQQPKNWRSKLLFKRHLPSIVNEENR